jgi:hypothetical protein
MSGRTSRSKTVSSGECSSEQDETLVGVQQRAPLSRLQPVHARKIERLGNVARVGHAAGGVAGIVTYDLDPAVVNASSSRVPSGMRKSVG